MTQSSNFTINDFLTLLLFGRHLLHGVRIQVARPVGRIGIGFNVAVPGCLDVASGAAPLCTRSAAAQGSDGRSG